MEILKSLLADPQSLILAVGGLLTFLAFVATMTETKRDDQIVGKVQAVIKRIGEFLAEKNK
jgi:hypothetical protein